MAPRRIVGSKPEIERNASPNRTVIPQDHLDQDRKIENESIRDSNTSMYGCTINPERSHSCKRSMMSLYLRCEPKSRSRSARSRKMVVQLNSVRVVSISRVLVVVGVIIGRLAHGSSWQDRP